MGAWAGALGWAGVAICPSDSGPTELATAHAGAKRLSFHTTGSPHAQRTAYTFQQPAALAFAETHTRDHLLAVAEGHQLSVWDLRASSKGGCVARVSPAGATNLSAVCGCGAGAVAVAGEERIVHVFDSKMWRVRARWPGALKYSIASICSSPCAEGSRVFVTDTATDLGGALISGETASPAKAPSFRGDSPWVGVAGGAGFVSALTVRGTLYAQRLPQ